MTSSYKCPNGGWRCACPSVYRGELIAGLIGGLFGALIGGKINLRPVEKVQIDLDGPGPVGLRDAPWATGRCAAIGPVR
jgi:hypothetical protein